MNLRGYQKQAINITLEKLAGSINKQVLVLATGLGKTVIFTHLISQLLKKNPGKKALILAHREELLLQAQEKINFIDPTLTTAIEKAEQTAEPDADVIIASVATIGREGSERIAKFNPYDFCIIVVDEAHHASANTYKNVLKYFGVLKDKTHERGYELMEKSDWNNEILLLGCTATPSRNDNEGIDKIFDEVVYNYGIIDGIKDNWLSRIRAYRVDTTTSLDEVHTIAGDFNQGELADAINNPVRNNLVVKTYQEQFARKQALVFAIDIDHAKELYYLFQDRGIATGIVDGNTPKEKRKLQLEMFHKKESQVMVNCMVLTEGYDNDTIDVIMLARPTKSGILYSQMIGRGTRLHKDKPYLTICDFVDNTYKHTIKTSASLLGIEEKINFRGQDIVEAQETIEKIRELAPNFDLNRLDMDKLNYLMEEIDIMSGLKIPKDIEPITHFSWYHYGDNGYRLSIGDFRYFVVEQNMLGMWEASYEYWDRTQRKTISEWLGEEEVRDHIIQRVDKYIRSNYKKEMRLIDINANWRKERLTEPQYNALKKIGVSDSVLAQLSKGQASQLQNKLYSQKRK